jgi:hypothetical protein
MAQHRFLSGYTKKRRISEAWDSDKWKESVIQYQRIDPKDNQWKEKGGDWESKDANDINTCKHIYMKVKTKVDPLHN